MEELDPAGTIGIGGVGLDGRMIKRDEIRLSDWWNLTKPGSYTVSISHTQPAQDGKRPEVSHAPDFIFNVVP